MLPHGVRPENQRRRGTLPLQTNESESDDSMDTTSESGNAVFNPGLMDVLKVRFLLQWKLTTGVPEELVDMIIDAAEYWPSIEHTIDEQRTIHKDCDQVLLKTVPLCYDRNACLSLFEPFDESADQLSRIELRTGIISEAITSSRHASLSQDYLQSLVPRSRRATAPP